MGKLRVYELAKELSMESREVIRRLGKMGCDVKNHMSTVEDKYADDLREMVKPGPGRNVVPPSQPVHKPGEVRPGDRPRPEGQGQIRPDQRPPYQSQGPRPPFQGDGQRPPYQQQGPRPEGQGPRPEGQGPRPPYQGQGQGPRPPFQGDGQRPPYQQGPRPEGQGPRPPYQGQGQGPRPPFQGDGQRPPYQQQGPRPEGQGPRPPFQGQGQRPPYQGQGQGPRPPFQGDGQRPPYQGQGQGPRPPFQGQGQGQRPPYQGQGQGQRPPFQGQGQGQRPPYQGQRPAAPVVIDKPLEKNPPGAKRPFKPDLVKKKPSEGTDARTKARKAGEFHSGDGEFRGRGPRGRGKQRPKMEIPPAIPKKVVIGETVTVQELAKGMGKTAAEVIKKLFVQGIMATINQELDSDTAVLLADEFGVPVEVRLDKTMEMMEDQDEDDIAEMIDRPPIVTVMGHVDHGKTSLLDAIRKANVIATEAGGITQHIGAYQVELPNSKKITFLDTPGHEAFTAMRARGAQVTDIAILVVAADDGVMPQTIEAINHAKAAKVPIIVAINKIDKPGANPDKVKQELTEHGVVSEEWGGETVMVPLSAKTQEGIPHLLEMILLVAEVAELKANATRMARGTVVEAQLDKGRGPVATVLVQKGTLKVGDMVVAGSTFGKVKAMIDDKGRRIKVAGPSTPVEVLGFSEAPPAGEIFIAVADDKDARYIAGKYQVKRREEEMHKTSRVSLDDLFKHIADGEIKELNIVIKADVQGSIEALAASLNKLSTGEVRVNIIHSGVGTITESDVMLASASNAIIIGFNVRPDANTRKALETEKIDLRLYRVIYDAIDDIKAAMTGLLDPTYKEVVIGRAEVRTTFKVPKIGTVAGCYLTEGKFTRQAQVRVIRDGIVVHEGKIESLRRFKDDVKEVASGFEFGLGIEKLNDLKELDIVEAFIMEELKREL